MYTEVYCNEEYVAEVAAYLTILVEKLEKEHPEWAFDASAHPCNWTECEEEEDTNG